LGSENPESISEAIKMLKPSLLVKIINAYKMDQAMIFCRTKVDCDNLEQYLTDVPTARKGPMIDAEYSCATIHSDKSGPERAASIKKFKDGEVRFLICTDIAARGIDIHELPYMISK
jgi:ATP-dependent RNA helicase DDX1